LFVYDELPLYVRGESTRLAVLFVDADGDTLLGFALAVHLSPCWRVEEFFIIARARRKGIGTQAAEALFAARPGRWTLTVRPENPAGLTFWRRVAVGAEEQVEVGEDDGVVRTRLSFFRSGTS
jgi:predicted acetyltransferase